MKEEKVVLKKLKEFGKSYDDLFAKLKEANKLSNKSYGAGKHIKKCFKFTVEFLKAQNVVMRYATLFLTFGIPLFIGYLKKIEASLVSDIPISVLIISGAFALLIILWLIDRNTLMKVTEPSDNLFHIGAYETYRNVEYKRNHDYFFTEVLSFDELKKDVEELIKSEKDDHKADVTYFEKTLREKDDLLMKSLGEISTLREWFNDYSIKHFKLDQIFQGVLAKLVTLSEQKLNVGSLDFHHYFTIHRIEPNEYKLIHVNHPHRHKVGINHHRKGNSHLYKAERRSDRYYEQKGTLISFTTKGLDNEDWIVTLYPKSRPHEEVHSSNQYDTLYVEDIISLWTSFLTLMNASKPNQNNPKGVGNHVKGA